MERAVCSWCKCDMAIDVKLASPGTRTNVVVRRRQRRLTSRSYGDEPPSEEQSAMYGSALSKSLVAKLDGGRRSRRAL